MEGASWTDSDSCFSSSMLLIEVIVPWYVFVDIFTHKYAFDYYFFSNNIFSPFLSVWIIYNNALKKIN